MFFSIYFAMTGLHGIHVLVGVFVFVWLLIRAIKGHFTPEYFGPIDYAALTAGYGALLGALVVASRDRGASPVRPRPATSISRSRSTSPISFSAP